METCFHHNFKKNEKKIANFYRTILTLFPPDCEIAPRNLDFFSQNCEFVTHILILFITIPSLADISQI